MLPSELKFRGDFLCSYFLWMCMRFPRQSVRVNTMRIAISGTHCMGKTTLIDDFLKAHPEYTFEEEPYYQLQEKHGVEFSEWLILEDFIQQLDYSIERLEELAAEENVIFDRCPLDFLAYSMALLHEEEMSFYDTVIIDRFPEIKEALKKLDLIVFLPITSKHPIRFPQPEGEDFRILADAHLKAIYREDLLDIFPRHNHPQIIEIWRSPQERLHKLELYLG